jgi:acetolactate synthase-1/2/3 large subunit
LEQELKAVLMAPGPAICEVVTMPDEQRAPRITSVQRADGSMVSKPLEDMWPFLERDEFRANMIVPPLEDA